jgi:thymidylate kinase
VLAITGSDGVGKSAVVSELNRMQPRRMQPCKAKKLYRRSLTYQLLAALVQSAAGWTMETLDDRIAPLLALRSAMALWPRVLLRLLFGSPVAVITGAGIATLVLDRSPAGVLLTHRKDLQPRQMTGTRWLERLLPPQTTVLLTLPFERLTARRVEMKTSDSHECYQRLLLQQALRSQPVELIVLNAAESVHLLARRVLRLLDDGTLEAKDTPTPAAASPSRSAPATTVKQPARRQRGEAA